MEAREAGVCRVEEVFIFARQFMRAKTPSQQQKRRPPSRPPSCKSTWLLSYRASLSAWKPASRCEPSQKGLLDDSPQRHSM